MAWNSVDRLRALLGERIPDGGSAADTYFSTTEIDNMLLEAGDNVRRAAYEGWQIKAAYYADLCNITEGNALRDASDLMDHALAMVKQFSGSGTSLTAGRTRVGRIVRRI
jgi:hypothetical protein